MGGEGSGRSPAIDIVVTSEDDALTIEVMDDGNPFNPLQDSVVPDVEAMIEDRPIGGLGVHLVKTLMQDLNYERTDGRNRLTMVARRDE